jgi:hypothetical protein
VRQEVRLQDPTQHAGAGTSATTPEVLPHQHLPVQLYKGVTVEDVTVSAPGAGKGVVVPCLRLPGSNFTIQLRNIRKRLLYIRFCLGRDTILSVSREKTNTRVIRCSYGPVFPQCDAPTEPPPPSLPQDAVEVRTLMESRKVKKEPGISCVDVNRSKFYMPNANKGVSQPVACGGMGLDEEIQSV